jgi:glycosyltransferase involved in cell wall biosynthesis
MINIFAPINTLGYGIFALNIIKALLEQNEDACLIPVDRPQLDPFFEHYVKKVINNRLSFDVKNLGLFLFHDEYSIQASGDNLKVLSMFETTKIKDLSKITLEKGPAKVVLTTTEEHKKILIENGITKPIEILRGGADDTIFNTIPVDKLIDTKKFTFITCGKSEERKNTRMIINAFIDTCSDKECALICHTFNPFLNKTKESPLINLESWCPINPMNFGFEYKQQECFGKYHKFSKDKCDIYFTFPGIPYFMLPSLYHSANVGIQCSRAEGWDLCLNELLACGKPSIATDCIGHSEYILDPNLPKEQKDLIITIKDTEPANDGIWFNGTMGNWGKIDQKSIEEKINYVLDNQTIYSTTSEDTSTVISTKYTWAQSVEKLLSQK